MWISSWFGSGGHQRGTYHGVARSEEEDRYHERDAGIVEYDEGACAGAGSTCFQADGYTKSVEFRLVGQGHGRYERVQTYDYVGQGAGSFEKEEVITATGWRVRPCCLFALGALSLSVVILAFWWPRETTTTYRAWRPPILRPSPPPRRPAGSCEIWGDPHIETFDHGFPNFYMEGEFWIVQSARVWIQGRYLATPFTHGLAATHSVAVGGPFLNGHVIQVGPMEGGTITLDRAPVLEAFPSSLELPGLGSMAYNGVGQLVDAAQAHLEKHIVHLDLPEGVLVEVMRWANHINLRIVMPPQPGQEGSCGNFDGDARDDTTDEIMARMGGRVALQHLLFHTQTEATAIGRQKLSLDDCPAERRRQSERLCSEARAASNDAGVVFESCVFDVCFGGQQYAREDALAE